MSYSNKFLGTDSTNVNIKGIPNPMDEDLDGGNHNITNIKHYEFGHMYNRVENDIDGANIVRIGRVTTQASGYGNVQLFGTTTFHTGSEGDALMQTGINGATNTFYLKPSITASSGSAASLAIVDAMRDETTSNRVFMIKADGKVGINIADPQDELDIEGGMQLTGNITMDNTKSIKNVGYLGINTQNPAGTNRFECVGDACFTSSKVGIGVTTPSFDLHVNGNVQATDQIELNSVATDGVTCRLANALNIAYLQAGNAATTGSSADLFIGNYYQSTADSVRKIMFKANGNVGIGTDNPSTALNVVGTVLAETGDIEMNNASTGGGVLNINGDAGKLYIQPAADTTTGSAADLFIGNYNQDYTTSTRKFIIKADGKVGIGTNNPINTLAVAGDIACDGLSSFADVNLNAHDLYDVAHLGINQATPARELDLQGSMLMQAAHSAGAGAGGAAAYFENSTRVMDVYATTAVASDPVHSMWSNYPSSGTEICTVQADGSIYSTGGFYGSKYNGLGGAVVAINGEIAGSVTGVRWYSYGNGSSLSDGVTMPAPGQVIGLGMSSHTTATTSTATIYKNNVSTGYTITITSGLTAFDAAVTGVTFVQGDRLRMVVTAAGSGLSDTTATMYIRYE